MIRRALITAELLTFVFIANVLVLAVSPALAQAVSTVQTPVRLAYKYPAGTVTRYRVVQGLSGTRKMPGSTQAVPIAAKLTTVVRIRCTKVYADGTMELAIDIEQGKLEMGGRPLQSYQPPKVIRTIRVTPEGKVVGPTVQNPGTETARRSPLDFGSADSTLMMFILPANPVLPGDKWETEITLPGEPSIKIKLAFVLSSVDTTTSGLIARIKQAVSTPISASASNEVKQVRGSQDGQAEIVFSIDKGLVLSAQGKLKSTIVADVAAPAMPGGSGSQDSQLVINMDSDFTIELLGVVPDSPSPAVR
ncbi:MAG: hypothetical protein K6U00_09820 [Armatimonadetes bacterium]|nr:hypothetical protein [Armatimonadota bacterium]